MLSAESDKFIRNRYKNTDVSPPQYWLKGFAFPQYEIPGGPLVVGRTTGAAITGTGTLYVDDIRLYDSRFVPGAITVGPIEAVTICAVVAPQAAGNRVPLTRIEALPVQARGPYLTAGLFLRFSTTDAVRRATLAGSNIVGAAPCPFILTTRTFLSVDLRSSGMFDMLCIEACSLQDRQVVVRNDLLGVTETVWDSFSCLT